MSWRLQVERLTRSNAALSGALQAAELQAAEWAAQCAQLAAAADSEERKQEALVRRALCYACTARCE